MIFERSSISSLFEKRCEIRSKQNGQFFAEREYNRLIPRIIFHFRLRLRANGRNKGSQHCCANKVGSCCVRVGSGVQTDARTPNNVGTYSAWWEGYNP